MDSSDASGHACPEPGCETRCKTLRGLQQHVQSHRDKSKKRKGTVKSQVGSKKKRPGNPHSASSSAASSRASAGTDMECDDTSSTSESVASLVTAGIQEGGSSDAAAAPATEKRTWTKRSGDVLSMTTRRRVTVIVEDGSADDAMLGEGTSEVPVNIHTAQENPDVTASPATGIIEAAQKKVTVVVEQLKGTEGDTQSDQPYSLEGIADDGSRVDVLYCKISEDIDSGSYVLGEIENIDIDNLELFSEPSHSDVNTTLHHVPTLVELLQNNIIDSLVNEEVLTDDVVDGYILENSPDRPDEEDLLSDQNPMYDYDFLLLGSIIEEDPCVEITKDDSYYLDCNAQLKINLSLLLSDDWVISSFKDRVVLSLLTPFENISVQRSISWNGKSTKIFVHNKEVPKENYVWNSINQMDYDNFGEVSDHLAKLAYLVESSMICCGVRLYSDVWEKSVDRGEGHIEKDFYQEMACLRDNNCSLLVIGAGICKACHERSLLLKHRHWRAKQDKAKDIKKVNINLLTGEEAKERLKVSQDEKRALEKKLYKLRERIRKFIAKEKVSVSTDFGNDLAKIFKDNYGLMTPVQKLFWAEQIKALSFQKNPRQMRWNPFVIKLALHLQMISSSSYDYVQNFVFLPSKRRLFDFTHYIEAKEGPQEHIMDEIQKKLKEEYIEEHEKFFNLIFDEMDVREDIVINRRTGEIVGYTHLSKVEEELASLEAEIISGQDFKPKMAKKVLVYMALGVTNAIQEVVAVYTTSGSLTAAQLHSRTWNVVYRMEDHGNKVLCLVCDGASTNKKFFRMHAKLDPKCDYVYGTKNIACGENRNIFFIVDPVHGLKSLRNNFANSYAHKKTRKMWKNGETLTWNVIEILYSIVQKIKYQDIKLTKSHVKLTSYSCMKVIYAAQVMSMSVVVALTIFEDDPSFQDYCLTELKKFIKLVNDWFDCMNGSSDAKGRRNKENELLFPYTSKDDDRFDFLVDEFLQFFEDWLKDISTRPGFSKESQEKMFISMQTFERSCNTWVY